MKIITKSKKSMKAVNVYGLNKVEVKIYYENEVNEISKVIIVYGISRVKVVIAWEENNEVNEGRKIN